MIFNRSNGETTVLLTAPATPPAIKSIKNMCANEKKIILVRTNSNGGSLPDIWSVVIQRGGQNSWCSKFMMLFKIIFIILFLYSKSIPRISFYFINFIFLIS